MVIYGYKSSFINSLPFSCLVVSSLNETLCGATDTLSTFSVSWTGSGSGSAAGSGVSTFPASPQTPELAWAEGQSPHPLLSTTSGSCTSATTFFSGSNFMIIFIKILENSKQI